jgi:hypothetical protein
VSMCVTTLITRRARATLVSKGDIGGDSPSLARDEVRGTKSPERSEQCSALIRMNLGACDTFLERS